MEKLRRSLTVNELLTFHRDHSFHVPLLVSTSCCWFPRPADGFYFLLLVYTSRCWFIRPAAGFFFLLLVCTSCCWYTLPAAGFHVLLLVSTSGAGFHFLQLVSTSCFWFPLLASGFYFLLLVFTSCCCFLLPAGFFYFLFSPASVFKQLQFLTVNHQVQSQRSVTYRLHPRVLWRVRVRVKCFTYHWFSACQCHLNWDAHVLFLIGSYQSHDCF